MLSFSGTDGESPQNSLTLSGSTLYGMTGSGGANSDGNIFSIKRDGSGFQNLLSFSGTNGIGPDGDLTVSGSTLYGMTWGGGANGDGDIFRINTDGSGFRNLLSFTGANGAHPDGGLTVSGSTLYGMTGNGGANGDGNIFRVSTDGTGFQTLLSFSGTSGAYPGAYPVGSLTLSGSTLYGTTGSGGANSDGNVFRVNTDGSGFQNLLSFNGTNGSVPRDLTLIGSTLYGMTAGGGANSNGNIFTINTNGSGFQNLLSFTGTGGAHPGEWPLGDVTVSGSTLYGTTSEGGAIGDGVVFSLTDSSLAVGTTLSWNQPGGGSWNSANNWDGNRIPGNNHQDTAIFGTAIGSNTATVTLDGSWTIGGLTFNTTGGGSYTISRSAGDSTSTLTLTGTGTSFPLTNSGGNHTIAVPVVLGTNVSVSTAPGSSLTFSSPISGSGSLTKTDAGALILAGSNIYSGGTEVDNGTLVAANGTNGSATGSGTVTLNGGTLASGPGGGSISGVVQIGSVASEIAPGGIGSIGNLTIGSLVTASNLTTLNFDLTTPGGSGDLLIITSPNGLTLAQHTAITFGTSPMAPGEYPLIGGSFGTPTLSYFDLPTAPSGSAYSLIVDQGYIDLVVVPEPSAFALLAAATVGLLGHAWRRRRRTA